MDYHNIYEYFSIFWGPVILLKSGSLTDFQVPLRTTKIISSVVLLTARNVGSYLYPYVVPDSCHGILDSRYYFFKNTIHSYHRTLQLLNRTLCTVIIGYQLQLF